VLLERENEELRAKMNEIFDDNKNLKNKENVMPKNMKNNNKKD